MPKSFDDAFSNNYNRRSDEATGQPGYRVTFPMAGMNYPDSASNTDAEG